MKKITGLMLVMMTATLLWGTVEAQAQRSASEREVLQLRHRSIDGTSTTILRAGAYRHVSLIGQSISGTLSNRSGGIWHLQKSMNTAQDLVASDAISEVPTDFSLEANYPNPFNPQTTIAFALPEATHVSIQVFDLLGQKVVDLVNGTKEAGKHTLVFDGQGLASGVYLYRMRASSFEQHRTMLLLK
ncbi:MAG TPA: T9SS type A sorting domain-containing protein [Rhodothermales bacterium]|nr:T9SS type A sorting domain-containing protein [Rhodothermales bacterium]